MRLFAPLYDTTLRWSQHRLAPRYLAGLSFAESTFFPVPPDVMLIPMVLGKPARWLQLAGLCTVMSVLGGLFGYLIGVFAFELIEPLLHRFGYWETFEKAQAGFREYGFWVVLLAGFSPIPYKIFTIASGTVGMALLPFAIGSLIGRGGRFFLVAGLIRLGGVKAADKIRQYVEVLGWLLVVLVVAAVLWLRH
ncbi:MAG: YqaA family protein [Pseudomonadota bacterium]